MTELTPRERRVYGAITVAAVAAVVTLCLWGLGAYIDSQVDKRIRAGARPAITLECRPAGEN